VETKNKLDELIYRTDKSFKEFEDKLSDDEKKELQEALEEGRNAIKAEDAQAIEQSTEKITQASHKLAELMYKQQAENNAPPSEEPQSDASDDAAHADDNAEESYQDDNDGDDVIDAEFTEK
jgi:molecular chaperone DnaK